MEERQASSDPLFQFAIENNAKLRAIYLRTEGGEKHEEENKGDVQDPCEIHQKDEKKEKDVSPTISL